MKSKARETLGMRARSFPGSAEAKRLAAGILEGLSGLRGTGEASTALGVSLTRYYHLEGRALSGLIAALEPRPKGRRLSSADAIARLTQEKERLRRELDRAQALVRVAQRTVGLPPARRDVEKSARGGKGGRRLRRTTVRAQGVVETLRQAAVPAASPAVEGPMEKES